MCPTGPKHGMFRRFDSVRQSTLGGQGKFKGRTSVINLNLKKRGKKTNMSQVPFKYDRAAE